MVVSSSVSPPGQSSWTRTRPPDVAPSLHRHYSDFITTTSDSAPVPRIGTQVLVGSPLERLPWHRDDWFPQFRRKARIRLTPPARRTPPGQASGQPPDFSRRYRAGPGQRWQARVGGRHVAGHPLRDVQQGRVEGHHDRGECSVRPLTSVWLGSLWATRVDVPTWSARQWWVPAQIGALRQLVDCRR